MKMNAIACANHDPLGLCAPEIDNDRFQLAITARIYFHRIGGGQYASGLCLVEPEGDKHGAMIGSERTIGAFSIKWLLSHKM